MRLRITVEPVDHRPLLSPSQSVFICVHLCLNTPLGILFILSIPSRSLRLPRVLPWARLLDPCGEGEERNRGLGGPLYAAEIVSRDRGRVLYAEGLGLDLRGHVLR